MPMLKRFLSLVLVFALTAGMAPRAHASAYDAHPKLVVILVIDQFREDYLERYRADFKPRGFRLFLDHGAYFPDCYYDYSNHDGSRTLHHKHRSLHRRSWHRLERMVGFDRNKERPVTSVEDERYAIVRHARWCATQPRTLAAQPARLHHW